MPDFTPPPPFAPTAAADDPRVGQLLGRALAREDAPARVVIAGFPTDVGVRRNGGRAGAAAGPAAIRAALHRLTPDAARVGPFTELLAHARDLGDLVVTDDLDADQRRLGKALAPHLAAGAFVILLGGGHETAYAHFLAQAELGEPVRILNWDAHADVRDPRDGLGHSGSPFRQALAHESGLCARYTVAGLQPHSVAVAHLARVRERGAAHFRDDVTPELVRALHAGEAPTMVTFDLDAVDRSCAPGVSAPATNGLPVPTWLRAAYLAGRTPSVRSADVVELSPPHDRDGQTAALAALTVWWILKGLAERP